MSLVRRAWRCGEDADVCSALLQDALDAVRALPDAALYAGAGAANTPKSQRIWAEVVDSAAKFLNQVVAGYVWFEVQAIRCFRQNYGTTQLVNADGPTLRYARVEVLCKMPHTQSYSKMTNFMRLLLSSRIFFLSVYVWRIFGVYLYKKNIYTRISIVSFTILTLCPCD